MQVSKAAKKPSLYLKKKIIFAELVKDIPTNRSVRSTVLHKNYVQGNKQNLIH